MLLTEKYAPRKMDDVLGNDEARIRIRQWILSWIAGKKQMPLLVCRPPGTGKTALAYAMKHEYDLDIIEMNASELRNKDRVEKIMHGSLLAGSLFGNGKIILIDDVDSLAGRKDSGGSLAINQMLKEPACPIYLTAGDPWDKKLSTIRNSCETVNMKKVGKVTVRKHLEKIAKKEGIEISEEKIAQITETSGGDVRAALNDLQANHIEVRDIEKDIFNRIRGLFKATTYEKAKEAMDGDIDYDLLKLWIDENIPYEYEKAEDVDRAYRMLARADVFDGRVKQSRWQLMRYSIAIATAGVALAKEKQYYKFTKYMFPGYLRSMGASKEKRAMLKELGKKIGEKTHCNKKEALEYLPLLKEAAKENQEKVVNFYNLDEKELAYILGTSVQKSRKKEKEE